MKSFRLPQIFAEVIEIASDLRLPKLPLYIFLGMCFNLLVAPVVYAATGDSLSHLQAWTLGLLGIVTLSLSTYLFFVMFIPEKF